MIELNDLSVRYGEKVILQDINLKIASKTWICLVGPNGAGKSTLIKALLGTESYGGSAIADGEEIYKARNRKVSYLPQNPQIPIGMRVREYIALGRRDHDGWAKESSISRALIDSALSDCGLAGLRDAQLTQLSGGERQRAHVARVLVQQADLVLLDEPTSALDLHHQIAILNIIEKLKENGATIISTMHDLTLAAMYVDEIAIISEGKLLNHGRAQEMIHGQDLKNAFQNRISVITSESGNPIILPQKNNELI